MILLDLWSMGVIILIIFRRLALFFWCKRLRTISYLILHYLLIMLWLDNLLILKKIMTNDYCQMLILFLYVDISCFDFSLLLKARPLLWFLLIINNQTLSIVVLDADDMMIINHNISCMASLATQFIFDIRGSM